MLVLSGHTLVKRITEKIGTCYKIWEKDNVGYNQCPVSPFFCFVYISERKLKHVIRLHQLKLLFTQLGGLMRLSELILQQNAVFLSKFWKLLNVYCVNLFRGNSLLKLT